MVFFLFENYLGNSWAIKTAPIVGALGPSGVRPILARYLSPVPAGEPAALAVTFCDIAPFLDLQTSELPCNHRGGSLRAELRYVVSAPPEGGRNPALGF